MISNVTRLIKALSGGHGSLRAESKAAIGFNLERSGSQRYWIGLFSFGFFKILHSKIGIFELLEEKLGFFGGSESSFIEISLKNFGRIEIGDIGGLVTEFTSDLKTGFGVKVFNFLFTLDDETEGWGLDATSRFSARYLSAHHTREVVAYEHIESLTGLLAGNHVHIDGTGIFDGFLEGWFGNLVKSNTMGGFR